MLGNILSSASQPFGLSLSTAMVTNTISRGSPWAYAKYLKYHNISYNRLYEMRLMFFLNYLKYFFRFFFLFPVPLGVLKNGFKVSGTPNIRLIVYETKVVSCQLWSPPCKDFWRLCKLKMPSRSSRRRKPIGKHHWWDCQCYVFNSYQKKILGQVAG